MKISLILFKTFQYFSSHFMVMVGIGLWELLHCILKCCNVDYERDNVLGPSSSLWMFLGVLIALMLVNILGFVSCLVLIPESYSGLIAPIFPVIVYPLLAVAILGCFGFLNGLWGRLADMVRFWRGTPTFRDSFMGDLLTSVTYAISGLTLLLFRWSDGRKVVEKENYWLDDQFGGIRNIVIHLAIALPYLLRLLQCLAETWYTNSSRKYPLLNALKYLSSILLQVFSALHAAHSSSLALRIIWIIFASVNSIYSWWWDIWRDWKLTERWANSELRPNKQMVFRWVFYLWFSLSDLAMRFYWGYKIPGGSHYSWTVFLFAGIEVLRRFQWAYFRVEREAQ